MPRSAHTDMRRRVWLELLPHRTALAHGTVEAPGGFQCAVWLVLTPDLQVGNSIERSGRRWFVRQVDADLRPARGASTGPDQALTGERTPQLAPLTEERVRAIRRLFAAGASKATLARTYGCTAQNITAIVTGRTWQTAGGPTTCGPATPPAPAPALQEDADPLDRLGRHPWRRDLEATC